MKVGFINLSTTIVLPKILTYLTSMLWHRNYQEVMATFEIGIMLMSEG